MRKRQPDDKFDAESLQDAMKQLQQKGQIYKTRMQLEMILKFCTTKIFAKIVCGINQEKRIVISGSRREKQEMKSVVGPNIDGTQER